jgi:hypothetical protein
MKKVLIVFAAGCFGALANSLVVWLCGVAGITQLLGVSIAPALTKGFLYPRIVWGGIWGLVFLFPLLKTRPMMKGTLLSLFPTLVQLFYVFPYQAHKGIAGLDLGLLTPVAVLGFNWVWGAVTALTIRFAK